MDLNIVLWIGGMLFSLGIFAVKVGLGLGYGNFRIKGLALTLTGYTALFMVIAVSAERVMKPAAPFLQRGPWMHTLLAAGLIIWGIAVISKSSFPQKGKQPAQSGSSRGASLLMIVPCPICLSAMTFSTWAALNSIKQPPLLLGLCLGLIFSILVLLVTTLSRIRAKRSSVSLGMAMIVVGLYFVLSLFLPAKIEAARGMYSSFASDVQAPAGQDAAGVLAFLIILLVAGFFAGKNIRGLK
jgi:predicted transporter